MIKIIKFITGPMGSGKTADLIRLYNAHKTNNPSLKQILVKPTMDTRDDVIKSRNGESLTVDHFIPRDDNDLSFLDGHVGTTFYVDEAQFLSEKQITKLVEHSVKYDCALMLYGIKTDFRIEFFEGSAAALRFCDELIDIFMYCEMCKTHKATINARIKDGQIVREGAQVQVGGSESYKSVCKKCYFGGKQ